MKLSTLIIFLYFFELHAQKTHQNLIWTRYYNQWSLNERWTWHNEIDERRFLNNYKHHHLIGHSRIHYKISSNADVAAGLTLSYQSPHDPKAANSLIIPEIRPVQEFNYQRSFAQKLTLLQRFRVDERFIHKNNGSELLDGYDFNFRFRYRIQLNYRINEYSSKTQTIFKINDEIMLNAGKNIVYNHFDQNRIYIAIEKGLNKNFLTEMGYLHWYQQRPSKNQFFVRDIARFTLYHKI